MVPLETLTQSGFLHWAWLFGPSLSKLWIIQINKHAINKLLKYLELCFFCHLRSSHFLLKVLNFEFICFPPWVFIIILDHLACLQLLRYLLDLNSIRRYIYFKVNNRKMMYLCLCLHSCHLQLSEYRDYSQANGLLLVSWSNLLVLHRFVSSLTFSFYTLL